jgi:hypothetical protein
MSEVRMRAARLETVINVCRAHLPTPERRSKCVQQLLDALDAVERCFYATNRRLQLLRIDTAGVLRTIESRAQARAVYARAVDAMRLVLPYNSSTREYFLCTFVRQLCDDGVGGDDEYAQVCAEYRRLLVTLYGHTKAVDLLRTRFGHAHKQLWQKLRGQQTDTS